MRDADHQVGVRRREHRLERLHRPPAGLRRVERRAAAGEDDARAVRQPQPGRHAARSHSGWAKTARLVSPGIAALYSIGRMAVFERQTLDNGLRVLTAPLPHAQSVACFVMLAAGSRYERAENRGIAHFAEHMFFKGTERRPSSRDLTTLIDGIGGEFNAFTSKEYTGYYVRCAGADRDTALDVLLDMLRHSKFDPEEIEREKGVILEEMNMYQDTPRDHIGTVYETLMFGDNPLGWETLGTKETIKRRDPRHVPRLRRTSGTRPTAWSSASAAWSATTSSPMLEELLGDMPAERPRELGAGRARPRTPGPHVARAPARTPTRRTSASACRAYPLEHPDRYALQLLATVLGSGMSSRLFLEVRERRGLAYYVHGIEPLLHRRRLAARAGGRRHQRASTRRSR